LKLLIYKGIILILLAIFHSSVFSSEILVGEDEVLIDKGTGDYLFTICPVYNKKKGQDYLRISGRLITNSSTQSVKAYASCDMSAFTPKHRYKIRKNKTCAVRRFETPDDYSKGSYKSRNEIFKKLPGRVYNAMPSAPAKCKRLIKLRN
jgi:hypothetical protein